MLNGFGHAFKSGGYPMMGTQGKVQGEKLSIPETLNASMVFKARYQESNGKNDDLFPGDSTNSGQWQIPDEFSLYFGGRIAETVGFFFEGNTKSDTPALISSFKMPAAIYVADAKISIIPFMTNMQGASYGYELASTGAARNQTWAEHRLEVSAQQYIGTDTPATGFAFVAQNDLGYINLSRWAPGFMAKKGAAQTLRSTYLRIALTPQITSLRGDWIMQLGAQMWKGSNYAYDTFSAVLKEVATEASAIDFQLAGQLYGKDVSLYATLARAPGASNGLPNYLNMDRTLPSDFSSQQRRASREARTLGLEYSLIQNTLHLGAAYRWAHSGGEAGAALSPNYADNALTLIGVYNLAQNIELHMNHTRYNRSQQVYASQQVNATNTGNTLFTLMLQASW